ncbi:hypothetical protein ACSQ67_008533 [Phaseolus vulgaris]
MAEIGLLGSITLSLCFFVLELVPHQAQAQEPSLHGLCTSSITIHGYKCQELQVTTEDGYILSLQRIPQGRTEVGDSETKKQPVIIQHGVLVDGRAWLLNSPEQNLPMILADNGFDVWIVNARGTTYSRQHISLDPSKPAYWNWCWDDMVTYDLPAIFNYVSNQTGQKINYVGHSLGTLIALASFTEGKLVNQLKSAALLCPVAYLSHMKTVLGVVVANSFIGEIMIETGDNCCLNSSTVNRFMDHEPQPTSTKNVKWCSTKFDNGGISPPIYNLSNIPHNLPLFISYGGEDALSDVDDVKNLLDHLKFHDVDKLSVQFIKDYAHADYVMGMNAKDKVYNDVTAFFNRQF